MAPATQDSRLFELGTPLGKDVLVLHALRGVEALSYPFEWTLEMLSEKGDVNPDDLLGNKISVGMTLPNKKKRWFHGFVSEFSTGAWVQNYSTYRAIVRPWFWLLTRTADCRIFQEMTVPQIFEEVVKQYGLTDYQLKLSGSYEPWEYCVQYRETDFNFLSRLLEQEGIYYFFVHEEDKHTMMLVDDASQHQAWPGYEKVPYYAPGGNADERERDHLENWLWTKSVQPGTYATDDFDFEKPRKSLSGSDTVARQHARADFEVFDYPAELNKMESSQTEVVAKVRIQELQTAYLTARGDGNAAGLGAGWKFTLDKYPRKDLNIDYLTTMARYALTADAFETGTHTGADFSIAIEAIDFKTPFRPARRTPKPVVQGAQTAMVVGKSGEEIFTDKYGRVKVQFHWDRYGKQDEKSSCWVRVSQLWAGKAWGGIHIPRIGQEVIVSFLEGDPDQPIITGRVYNGDSMPPYTLPANATQSGIKSRSSKGGGEANFNEIRFEDLKGSEQVYIHAEKNQDIVVENDETQSIGHDETITVGNNRTERVGVNETINIGSNRVENVGKNETITIGSNRTISVGASESASVALQRTHNVGINETISVGAAQEVNIGAAQTITVGAAQATTVGADQTNNIGASRSINVGSDQSVTIGAGHTVNVSADEAWSVGGGRTTSIGKDDALSVANNLNITAGDSITITTGDASISMKKDGTIIISGKDITIDASGKVNVSASSDITMKGSKIKQN